MKRPRIVDRVAEHHRAKIVSRIEQRFTELRGAGRAGFAAYLTAGDPDPDTSAALFAGLPEAGADLIEIGMPFSDPMADGPAIQDAGHRALKAGMTLRGTLALVRGLRRRDDSDADRADGLLQPDLPLRRRGVCAATRQRPGSMASSSSICRPRRMRELAGPARAAGLDVIRLATPTSDEQRLPRIVEGASGFIYYVAIAGITGTRSADTGRGRDRGRAAAPVHRSAGGGRLWHQEPRAGRRGRARRRCRGRRLGPGPAPRRQPRPRRPRQARPRRCRARRHPRPRRRHPNRALHHPGRLESRQQQSSLGARPLRHVFLARYRLSRHRSRRRRDRFHLPPAAPAVARVAEPRSQRNARSSPDPRRCEITRTLRTDHCAVLGGRIGVTFQRCCLRPRPPSAFSTAAASSTSLNGFFITISLANGSSVPERSSYPVINKIFCSGSLARIRVANCRPFMPGMTRSTRARSTNPCPGASRGRPVHHRLPAPGSSAPRAPGPSIPERRDHRQRQELSPLARLGVAYHLRRKTLR